MLRRCHNKLHGRGIDGDEEDLTMDMVRLMLEPFPFLLNDRLVPDGNE